MKRTLLLCLLVVISLAGIAWSQSTEQAVAALENKWLESQKTNNPDLIAPSFADNIVSTTAEGKTQNKSEMLAEAKATKYHSAEYEDVKVTVYGDTAIATGGFKANLTDPSGKTADVHDRWTDTWVKMPNGEWQCVATQTSPLKM
jgi:uncharacterized protein (TIGR02246 family)